MDTKPIKEQIKAALASFGRVLAATVSAAIAAALASVRSIVEQNGLSTDVLLSDTTLNAVSAAVVAAALLTLANWLGTWNDKFGRVKDPVTVTPEPVDSLPDESMHEDDAPAKEDGAEPVIDDGPPVDPDFPEGDV